jgi:hypothetical protein
VVAVLGEILCAGAKATNDAHQDQLSETAQTIKKFSVPRHHAKNSTIRLYVPAQVAISQCIRGQNNPLNKFASTNAVK